MSAARYQGSGANQQEIAKPELGFSYDVPTNGSLDLLSRVSEDNTSPAAAGRSSAKAIYLNGTFRLKQHQQHGEHD